MNRNQITPITPCGIGASLKFIRHMVMSPWITVNPAIQRFGENRIKENVHRMVIMIMVDFRLKHLYLKPNGFMMAIYLSTAIVVIVKMLLPTDIPEKQTIQYDTLYDHIVTLP